MSRSKLVVLLLVWFTWATGKDLDALIRYSVTSDFYVLSSAGVGWLFFAMGIAVFALNTLSLYYIWRPQPSAPRVLFHALAAGIIQNAVTLTFALNNLPGAREAYARGRELRGLSVREDALNMIFTTEAMWTAGLVMVILYVAAGFVVFRARAQLSNPGGPSGPASV